MDAAVSSSERGRVPAHSETERKVQAVRRLTQEVQKGWDSVRQGGWISEEEARRLLEVEV